MKKNNFLITALFSILLFSGCNSNNDSIRVCADFIATVVSDAEGAYLVELDGGEKFYSSETLNRAGKKFELGDRLYFRYFEINYDEQPDGAVGSMSHPYQITSLAYEKMDVYAPVEPNDEVNNLADDELRYFYAPYLEQTTILRNYLNFTFLVPMDSDPKVNLIYNGMKGDTLFYDFKATYKDDSNASMENGYIETFELKNLPEKGHIHITFHAKSYDKRIKGFISGSAFVLPFELEKPRP